MKQEGYVIVESSLCGGPILWRIIHENGDVEPDIYGTEMEAWKEIAANYVEQLEQFIDGERGYEETEWDGPTEYVALYQLDDNGIMTVSNTEGNTILEMPLVEWQNQYK